MSWQTLSKGQNIFFSTYHLPDTNPKESRMDITCGRDMENSPLHHNKKDEAGHEHTVDHHHLEVDVPCWADLLPDALSKIFSRLSLEDMLSNIPRVCRTWRRASHDAVCWQSVDLDEWSHGRKPEALEKMLVLLMNRSRGCLREICAPKLSNDNMLRLIAWRSVL